MVQNDEDRGVNASSVGNEYINITSQHIICQRGTTDTCCKGIWAVAHFMDDNGNWLQFV